MDKTRCSRSELGAAVALAALLSAPTPAQDVGAGDETRPTAESIRADEQVIVRGQRLSELEFDLRIYIKDFIEEVAAPARTRGYARWQRGVCIGVHNLAATGAQYIIDRISSLALDVGLEPGEPGCSPQVNIVFVTNGRETAAALVESEPRFFRPALGNAGMDLGFEGLDEFTQSDKAVRWWHISMPVDARTGGSVMRFPGQPPPVILKTGVSRLYDGIRDELRSVLIIVDSTKLAGSTWQQLSDYLALVSLAQISPWTNPAGFDSILNLFSNPAAYSGLTDWDVSYLHALYAFDQERDARMQRNLIVSEIMKREQSANE
jgi:hypothetical protein